MPEGEGSQGGDQGTSDKDRNWKRLREAKEGLEDQVQSQQQRISQLEQKALEGIVHQAGYDPSNKIVGLVANEIYNSLDDDADVLSIDPDQFAEVAVEEYGLEPESAQTEQPQDQSQSTQDQHLLNQMKAGAQTSKSMQAASTTEQSPTQQTSDDLQRAQKAEQEGNWGESAAAKLTHLAKQHSGE